MNWLVWPWDLLFGQQENHMGTGKGIVTKEGNR
jgi:hypothetical protein